MMVAALAHDLAICRTFGVGRKVAIALGNLIIKTAMLDRVSDRERGVDWPH